MLSATLANRKVIMQTSALKNQKTSGGLGNFYVGN